MKTGSPSKLWNPFRIDTRSLALFRIGLGFLIALDCFHKLFLARDFYSDWGVMPRSYWIDQYVVPMKLSIHLASGDAWLQYLLLGVQLAAALAFMIGWRTRLAGGVALALLSSLQTRNSLILSASDELMRLMLLWSFFVPVSRRFAVEAPARAPGENDAASAGTAILLLQLFSVYFFTAILKLHPVWTTDFSAIYFALNIDIFATPLAVWFRQFYKATQLLTATTLAWEIAGPFVAILFGGWIRFAASILFIVFHLSLTLFFNLGLFPWVAIAYWLVYWPGVFWRHPVGARIEAGIDAAFAALARKLPPSIPFPGLKGRLRTASQAFALFLFALATLNNFASVKYITLPGAAANAVRFFYVDQTWDMFAPYPMKNDGWFVIEGNFQNGDHWDLWNGGPVSYDKPEIPSAAYHSSEWRKFMLHVWDDGSRRILLPFSRFLCRKYSQDEGLASGVATIQVNFVKETTPEPGQPFAPAEVVKLWSHDCFAP